MKLVPVALTAIVAGFATSVQANPSFDCNQTNTQVEKLICSSAELSMLDNKLSSIYNTSLKNTLEAPANEMLRIGQQKWLEQRNLCKEETCIRLLYDERITALQPQAIDAVSQSSAK